MAGAAHVVDPSGRSRPIEAGHRVHRDTNRMRDTTAFSAHDAAMGTTKSFHHKDYELLCSAKVLDSGKFVPTLVVSRQRWPSRPRTISVPSEGCLTEEDAISSAYAQGVDWVLNYG